MTEQSTAKRSAWGRGSIRKHRSSYQIRVPAGTDPATGERITLQGTAANLREAEKLRTKLLAEADSFRSARTRATLGYLLDRWLPRHDIDPTTRRTYEGYIRNHIRPAIGDVPLTTLVRKSTDMLEGFYADLRGCRDRCSGRPFIEHRAAGPHDCDEAHCRPHQCQPLTPSSVRQIHAVLSAACGAAVRWGWIPFNPTDAARRPAQPRPNPQPPSPVDAARIVERAMQDDAEWGLYIWLAIVTGARRGELCALWWSHIDLVRRVVTIERNYVEGKLKDTKTHQKRRVSIDEPTADLLRQHRVDCELTFSMLGAELPSTAFVFSAVPSRTRPRDPSHLTHRYRRMVTDLGLDTHLHALRHYSATELLSAGVDLRTVSGRLGHADGTTTLRHYAAWVNEADQQAASILSAQLRSG